MAARTMVETLSVRYEFTAEERADLGQQLGELHEKAISLGEEEKSLKAQITERKTALIAQIGTLSRMVTAKFEMRSVPTTLQWDSPNVGEVSYFRQDNGEFLKSRPMTVAERQLELPLEGNGGPQLLEFPQQVQNSVEKSAAAVSEFFDTASKTNGRERIEVIQPSSDPTAADLDAHEEEAKIAAATARTEHPEPPVSFSGSLEEYKALLEAEGSPESLPPMKSGPKDLENFHQQELAKKGKGSRKKK